MKNSDKQNNHAFQINLSKLSHHLTIIATVAVLVFLISLAITPNIEVTSTRTTCDYHTITDYTYQEVTDTSTPIGMKKEYTFTLKDKIPTDSSLAFYIVHQYAKVYLEGEEIYSLQSSHKGWLGNMIGSNWVVLPIYREDAGKEIRVEITPVYESVKNREVEFLQGSELAIYKNRFRKDLPQLILGIMAVLVGLVYLCVAGFNLLKKHRGKQLTALGMFSVLLGIWRLTDTRFTPYMMPDKPVLLFGMTITVLMFGMLPVIAWLKGYFEQKSQRILDGYCIMVVILGAAQLMLQIFGIKDLRATLSLTHIVIAVGAVLILGIVLWERKKKKSQIMIGKKLPLICVAGFLADVIAYYIKGNSSGLLFSLLAFLLYIVFMGIATMYHYGEQEKELAEKDRKLAEQERQLTHRRIATMMSQIRSHFIFNVLTTISGYSKIDPQKADTALIRFSRYLRKNISIIEQEGLIDFSVELEQLEDYVALEQLRFQDQITFEQDIEVMSFQLPPLTIQPLVENAIKHGFIEHGRSGIVHLHTRREEQEIVIVVTDNGVGFSVEECEQTDSVGIRNVRYRIEHMMQGSLTIESTPGVGTKAIIRIKEK